MSLVDSSSLAQLLPDPTSLSLSSPKKKQLDTQSSLRKPPHTSSSLPPLILPTPSTTPVLAEIHHRSDVIVASTVTTVPTTKNSSNDDDDDDDDDDDGDDDDDDYDGDEENTPMNHLMLDDDEIDGIDGQIETDHDEQQQQVNEDEEDITCCEVCYTEDDASKLRHCPRARCQSVVCHSCLKSWLNVRMQYGNAYDMTCLGCPRLFTDKEIATYCGDRALRKCQYLRQKFALRSDPDALWCPVDGCWALLPPPSSSPSSPSSSSKTLHDKNNDNNNNNNSVVECPQCHTNICRKCALVAHHGKACVKQAGRQDVQSRIWNMLHTKKCPVCYVRIERVGGCAQMRCTSCQSKFCWRCRGVIVAFNDPCEDDDPDDIDLNHHHQHQHYPRPNHYRHQQTVSSATIYDRSQPIHHLQLVHHQHHPIQVDLHHYNTPNSLHQNQNRNEDEDEDETQLGNQNQNQNQKPQLQQKRRRRINHARRRKWRQHGCICPRVHATLSWISFTGAIVILAPIAVITAAAVAPPALVVYVVLPRDRKRDMRRRVIALFRRL